MTIQDFAIDMKRAVEENFEKIGMSDCVIKTDEVIKTNDTVLHALAMHREGSVIGVNVYIDELYRKFIAGEDRDDIVSEVTAMCIDALDFDLPPSLINRRFDFESIRSRLRVRLIDAARNLSYMSDLPYIDLGCGLALIADINSEESLAGEWRVVVTSSLVKSMKRDKEELLSAAMENTIDREPPVINCLADAAYNRKSPNLYKYPSRARRDPEDVYCLTNKSRFLGAAALFYPGLMEAAAGIMGCGYYVIPSSVHEMILVPETADTTPERLRDLLIHANCNFVVDEMDILSDRIFHYEPGDERLTVAAGIN